MTLNAGEFREAVTHAAVDVPIQVRARVVDMAIDDCRREDRPLAFTSADVERTTERARLLWNVGSAVKSEGAVEAAPLPSTPFARNTAADWLETFKPLVHLAREKAFGVTDPPFRLDEYARAVEWIETEADALPPRPPITDEAIRSNSEVGAELRKIWGPGVSIRHTSFIISYVTAGGDEFMRVLRTDEPRDQLFRFPCPPIAVVAGAANTIARVTGFRNSEVVRYLLCGVPPTLRRAIVSYEQQAATVPNAEYGAVRVVGTHVTVRLNSPDLTWDDLRSLQTEIRAEWESAGVRLPNGSRQQRQRLTARDQQLIQVVDALDGHPDIPDQDWWERVAERWESQGYAPRKADSHRRHWERLQTKRERFDLSVGTVKPSAGRFLPATVDLP